MLYVANVAEDEIMADAEENEYVQKVREFAAAEGCRSNCYLCENRRRNG